MPVRPKHLGVRQGPGIPLRLLVLLVLLVVLLLLLLWLPTALLLLSLLVCVPAWLPHVLWSPACEPALGGPGLSAVGPVHCCQLVATTGEGVAMHRCWPGQLRTQVLTGVR